MKRFVKKYLFKFAPQLAFALTSLRRRRRDHRQNLAARKIARAEIFKNAEPVVVTGPFAGMRYIDEYTFVPIALIWSGIYEAQLNPWVRMIIDGPYDSFIDIGAAEGYYAVGIARARPDLNVVTFEADPFSRRAQRRLAGLNGVTNIDVRSLCDHRTLEDVLGKRPVILCDIEGGEVDLIDPIRVPGLRRADLIVETHLYDDLTIPQVTELLAERFRGTHRIEVVHANSEEAEKAPLLEKMRRRGIPAAIVNEIASIKPPTPNEWLILTAQQNNDMPRLVPEMIAAEKPETSRVAIRSPSS